jgi:hypothetical protein
MEQIVSQIQSATAQVGNVQVAIVALLSTLLVIAVAVIIFRNIGGKS